MRPSCGPSSWAYLIWGDVPNALAVVGTLIIVASGLYTMHRETMHMRRRKMV